MLYLFSVLKGVCIELFFCFSQITVRFSTIALFQK